MDVVVRGVRTGLPLGDCLKIIAHESPDPLGAEFRKVVEGEALGIPIDICLASCCNGPRNNYGSRLHGRLVLYDHRATEPYDRGRHDGCWCCYNA